MTIDEAIKHCDEVIQKKRSMLLEISDTKEKNADDNEIEDCIKCKEEHEQLKEWLEEYKLLKEKAIPKRPNKRHYDNYYCPECHKQVFMSWKECKHCNQNLDWSEK